MNESNGLYLGATTGGGAYARDQRSVLVLGPSRSGKTSSLIVPNLLMTSRAVVATSTKPDVVAQLAHARRDRATLLFDPSGTIVAPPGVQRVGWSPLRASTSWDGAILTTRSLVESARRGVVEHADDHWTERASALVAPLLHAGAITGEGFSSIVTQIDRRSGDDALVHLRERYGDAHPSVALLSGVLASEERERSSIWSTASGLFAGVRTEAARQSSRESPLDIDAFLREGHHLHIVSPSRHQGVSGPLVVGLIDEIIDAAYRRHPDGPGVLLALDEVANVAPLPRLTRVVSEGGGQGVVTLACLQDLSQARARWGDVADGFISLFPTTVVLGGIADRVTLELLQSLAGRVSVPSSTLQRDHRGRPRGRSDTHVDRDRVSLAQMAQGREGYAMALDESKRARWVQLTPAHLDERFARYLSRDRPSPSRDGFRERT